MISGSNFPTDFSLVPSPGRLNETAGDIPIIQDAAHSIGTTYKGKQLAEFSDYVMYSFQAIKHLTTGDGGLLFCPNEEFYEKAKLLRWYGIDRENNSKDFRCEADVEEWGFKFHMNDVNASIGMANLKDIDKIIDRHKDNGRYYNENLKDVPGVTLLENKDDRETRNRVLSWRY